ncbi:MAG: hypothetical protein ABSD29_14825, partial [Verrucomicrobiota bacterium]
QGRCFFEEVLRENIDWGRPEQGQLILARKRPRKTAPDGRCRTRIITQGVVPSLHVYYKNTHLQQYPKPTNGSSAVASPNGTTHAPQNPPRWRLTSPDSKSLRTLTSLKTWPLET